MRGKRNQGTLWATALAALLIVTALPAPGAAADLTAGDAPIAAMAIHGDSVSFAPLGSFEAMTLTVGGQGHFSKQTFRGGETASFVPVDGEGFQLPDGFYKWELVASPSLRDLDPKSFRNGKISADGRTMEVAQAPRGQRQSGAFTIKNGVMVDPNLIEARGSRAESQPVAAEAPSAAARSAEHTDQDGN